jgi:hypothetical protein
MNIAAFIRRMPLLAVAASLTVVAVAQAASASASASAPAPVAAPSVAAATKASITLYWSAPSDSTIVGYAMYVNGTRVAGVQNIHYTFSNLKCGTSYTLSLDSNNQVQAHSAQTSITTSTAPCAAADTLPVPAGPPPPEAAPEAPRPLPRPLLPRLPQARRFRPFRFPRAESSSPPAARTRTPAHKLAPASHSTAHTTSPSPGRSFSWPTAPTPPSS